MQGVIWKMVVGFEGFYEVSNTGLVRSIDRIVLCRRAEGALLVKKPLKGRLLAGGVNSSGYPLVILYRGGSGRNFTTHRVVMAAFHGPSDLEVNHIDGNRMNNALSNLEYCTRHHNAQHRARVLLRQRGEENSASKLTNTQVAEILADTRIHRLVAAQYGVSKSTIYRIRAGKSWLALKSGLGPSKNWRALPEQEQI